MKRRSKAGGKASKALGREALKTKRRDAPKTASSCRLTRECHQRRPARVSKRRNEGKAKENIAYRKNQILPAVAGKQ
jgi:hypothetical protein